MPGLELNPTTLVSFLQQDRVFVDYFNEYLSLPIFCLRLYWDSLTASISQNHDTDKNPLRSIPCSSIKSDVCSAEQLIEWTIEHRLIYFQKSELYNQFKLFRQLSKLEVVLTNKNASAENPCAEFDTGENTKKTKLLSRHHSSVARTSFPPILKDNSGIVRSQSYPTLLKNIHKEEFYEDCRRFQPEDVTSNGRESVLEFKTEFLEEESLLGKFDSVSPGSSLGSIEVLKIEYMYEASDMKAFTNFVTKIPGAKKLHLFWMEIEVFKTRGDHSKEDRMRIFRLIQEQFYSHLTSNAQAMILESVKDQNTALEFLTQAQNDVFERLHNYWLPRYILHCAVQQNKQGNDYLPSRNIISCETIFPKFSFAKSLPVFGEQVKKEAKSKPFQDIIYYNDEKRENVSYNKASTNEQRNDLLSVINTDRESGSPFSNWMELNCKDVSIYLTFLLDLKDLKYDVAVMKDRLLKVCAVWKFFHKHFASDECELATNEEITSIHSCIKNLQNNTKDVLDELFSNILRSSLDVLQPYWIEYYSQDVFAQARNPKEREEDENVSSSRRRFERKANKDRNEGENKRWVERHPGSTESQRRSRLQTAMSIAERCSSLRERRFVRTKDDNLRNKSKEDKDQEGNSESEDSEDEDDDDSEEEHDDFLDNVDDTEIMSSFKSFIQNEEGRGMMNDLLMYLEIDTYFSLGPGESLQKNQNALAIYKTFFEKSRRSAHLPQILLKSVRDERPTSAVLREAQQYVLPQLTTCFTSFTKYGQRYFPAKVSSTIPPKGQDRKKKKSTGKHWKDATTIAQMSRKMKQLTNKKKRRRGGSVKASVTKEDRQRFHNVMSSTPEHKKLAQNFQTYLLKCEDSRFPRLEKNLLFYLEVLKFKEFFSYFDEISLNRKAEVIVDVFLDSASPPWLQVDVSPEIASRISQRVQQSFGAKKRIPYDMKDSTIFDDAQRMVLKKLLPFWSGFLRNVKDEQKSQTPKKESDTIGTKVERRQRQLYAKFLNFQEKLDPVHVEPSMSDPANENMVHNRLLFSLRGYKWQEDSAG